MLHFHKKNERKKLTNRKTIKRKREKKQKRKNRTNTQTNILKQTSKIKYQKRKDEYRRGSDDEQGQYWLCDAPGMRF